MELANRVATVTAAKAAAADFVIPHARSDGGS
jgi:hypothetical protein